MNYVSHKGRICGIDPDFTRVEIVSTSACSECHAKSLCSLSEETVKVIEVPTDGFADRKVGDEVEVLMKRSMGLKAVWLCYVIPLAVLMAVILVCSAIGLSELACGACAIAAVAVYYLILRLMRDRLCKDCVFYLK